MSDEPLTPEHYDEGQLRTLRYFVEANDPTSQWTHDIVARLLATLDRERRERVDPDLRARIEALPLYQGADSGVTTTQTTTNRLREYRDAILAILAGEEPTRDADRAGVPGDRAMTGTPLTPEEEADLRGSLDLRIAGQGQPTINPLSTADRVAFQRLLATVDRERRERVAPLPRCEHGAVREPCVPCREAERRERVDPDLLATYAAALPLLRRITNAGSYYPSGLYTLPRLDVTAGIAGLGNVTREEWNAVARLVWSVESDEWARLAATPDHTVGGEEREDRRGAVGRGAARG